MFTFLTIKNKTPFMHTKMKYAAHACVEYISGFSLLELKCNCDIVSLYLDFLLSFITKYIYLPIIYRFSLVLGYCLKQ